MHHALFCLLYGSGARISEIVRKLKPSDIELDGDGYLKINIITLKHRKNPLREVFISPKRQWLIDSILFWKRNCPFEVLFPISRQRAWALANRYFDTKTHSFRHSDATRSGKLGNNPWEMQQRFGWAKLDSSMPYVMASGEDSKRKQ